jgi:DNA replication initiation complex subunit (GINS family)
MDIGKNYKRLYEHWLQEFQQTELTHLDQDTFIYYKKMVHFVNNYNEEATDNIQKQLIASYKYNINYLFNDLFKMREKKLIDASLALKEINLDDIIEAEKLLYQNLIRSIKGYNQVKALSIFEETGEMKQAEIEEYFTEQKVEIKKQNFSDKVVPSQTESTAKVSKEDYNYILIRFIKPTEALVGIDLINYGPFKKQDIAYLPYDNAKILLYEKFAEKIDLS